MIMVRNFQPAAACRALKLLERHQGLFNDRLQVQRWGWTAPLESIAEVASGTPAGRIKARCKNEPTKH